VAQRILRRNEAWLGWARVVFLAAFTAYGLVRAQAHPLWLCLALGVGAGALMLASADLGVLASIIAASQYADTSTVGVVVANPLAPVGPIVVAASSGLPLFFVFDAIPNELLALDQRLPTFSLILRVGIDPLLIQALRRG